MIAATTPRIRFTVPFFQEASTHYLLQAVARAWLGTPFHAHAQIRGAGVDCVHLCAGIYIECGVMEIFDPPRYTLDGGKHAPSSLVQSWLANSPHFNRQGPIGPAEMLPGDLLAFTFGAGRAWHVGMMLDPEKGEFIHAIADVGVVLSSIYEEKWMYRIAAIYRPVKTA